MRKHFFKLLCLMIFSIPVFAEDDAHPNPVEEPVEFVGKAVGNTVILATGAIVGTVQSLGSLVGIGDDDEE